MNAVILTLIFIPPCSKQGPLQVSIEHCETRRQTMQADYRSSFARVGNRIGDENFMHTFPDNAMPVSKDPPPEPSLTSPQFNAADSLDVPGQTLETLCVVFRNLPVETTIDDVAEKLRAPPREGGCGVSISSSAILPSLDCVSFVVGFESLHEAKMARLGWDGLDLGHSSSAMPAPQSLLSVLTLTPYRPFSASTFVGQPNRNVIEHGPHPRRSAPAYNRLTPISTQPHRPGPYYVPSRATDRSLYNHTARSPPGTSSASRFSQPGPSTRPMFHRNPGARRTPSNSSRTRNSTIPASQPGPPPARDIARHHYLGYMRQKGHMSQQD
jgi:hypothetical protein